MSNKLTSKSLQKVIYIHLNIYLSDSQPIIIHSVKKYRASYARLDISILFTMI